MKFGRTLQDFAAEIARREDAKKDYLANTNSLSLLLDSGTFNLDMTQDGASVGRLDLNEIAHRQIGEHLRIPAKYYDYIKEEFPDLLLENVNYLFNEKPSTRMIRTLDGTARAFLSERYRASTITTLLSPYYRFSAKWKWT